MSNTQPEELQLACELDDLYEVDERPIDKRTAAALRRQYAKISELRAILAHLETVAPNVVRVARAAIAKATGEQA